MLKQCCVTHVAIVEITLKSILEYMNILLFLLRFRILISHTESVALIFAAWVSKVIKKVFTFALSED